MKKPVFAMLLGGFLGIFDGLTALITGGPEIPSQIGVIVAGSMFKGLVAGAIIGLVAQKTQSMAITVTVGLAVSAFFATSSRSVVRISGRSSCPARSSA